MSRVLPILFNTDMVRAILDGRKTVTRRAIKKLPEDAEFAGWLLDSTCQEDAKDIGSVGFKTLKQQTEKAGCIFVKPPYQPGDIIYVRETFCPNYFDESIAGYRGDGLRGNRTAYKADYHKDVVGDVVPEPKWHPSIHMPKEVARIWLKVTNVRVERLQDITPQESWKEGTRCNCMSPTPDCAGNKTEFIKIWDSTLKKSDLDRYGWYANPWLWVIEFERYWKEEGDVRC